MKKLCIFFLFIAALLSCKQDSSSSNASTTDAANNAAGQETAGATQSEDAPPNANAYQGELFVGNGFSQFELFGDPILYYIVDSTGGDLVKRYGEVATLPEQYVYAYVKGRIEENKNREGAAAHYSLSLIVREIVSMEPLNKDNVYPKPEFILSGTEPFWSLMITPSKAYFTSLATNEFIQYPYNLPATAGKKTTYEFKNKTGQTLKAVIEEAKCSDGMSENEYLYKSAVTAGRKTYKGCGEKIVVQ